MSIFKICSVLFLSFLVFITRHVSGEIIVSENHETGETLIYTDDPENRVMTKDIDIELSNQVSVKVFSKPFSDGTYIFIGKQFSYALRHNRYIKEYAISSDKKTVIFLVYRGSSTSSAGWYSSLLVVHSSNETSELVVVRDTLSAEYMKDLSLRRMEVVRLGNIDEYPNVSAEMFIQENIEMPSRALYNWQTWDIERETLIDFAPSITGPNGSPIFSNLKWTPRELMD